MRLSEADRATIREQIRAAYGADAVIRLFGSRGADFATELRLRPALEDALGGRKVDLVVMAPDFAPRPIDRLAFETGIEL